LKPLKKALEICSSAHLCSPAVDLSCCPNKPFQQDDLLSVWTTSRKLTRKIRNLFSFLLTCWMGQYKLNCFKNDEVATPLELLEVFDRLTRHESTLSIPPEEFLTSCQYFFLETKCSGVYLSRRTDKCH